MPGLGNVQGANQVAYVDRTIPRRVVKNEGDGSEQREQDSAAVIGVASESAELMPSVKDILDLRANSGENAADDTPTDDPQSASLKSFPGWLREAVESIESGERPTTSSDSKPSSVFTKMDLSFGVEEMTYKNMWKVLKTVIKEIGDIKEASSGQFFLGVSERLEKATTLMQFGSIVDYMDGGNAFGQKIPVAIGGESEQIVVDPAASVQAQANMAPDTALHLLVGAG